MFAMKIDVLTIFPEMFAGPMRASILQRAQEQGAVSIAWHDIREYCTDKHRKVDDVPYGGGAGMVMKPEPLAAAIEAVSDERPVHRVMLSASGRPFTQAVARELCDHERLLLVCGRYEGVDQRIHDGWIDDEVSIGDYVLTGGELPAMVVIDAVTRLLPGVLGNESSLEEESFTQGLLEYPQYTRPAEFAGRTVPEVLLSGDHKAIAKWRKEQSLERTRRIRPELLEGE